MNGIFAHFDYRLEQNVVEFTTCAIALSLPNRQPVSSSCILNNQPSPFLFNHHRLCNSQVCHSAVAISTMSNYDPNQGNQSDASPEETQSSKRRRIALACLDCRRRKLKCDRNFPACSRCQKSGNAASCIYDPDAVEAIAISASAERNRTNGTFINGHGEVDNGSASKTGTSPSSFVHHHALDTDESAVAGLRAHIYRLENRVIGLEKITNDPQHRYGTLAGSRARVSQTRAPFPEKSVPEDSEKELMLFRGKSFKTQFYGVSHHTSYLSCVSINSLSMSVLYAK